MMKRVRLGPVMVYLVGVFISVLLYLWLQPYLLWEIPEAPDIAKPPPTGLHIEDRTIFFPEVDDEWWSWYHLGSTIYLGYRKYDEGNNTVLDCAIFIEWDDGRATCVKSPGWVEEIPDETTSGSQDR